MKYLLAMIPALAVAACGPSGKLASAPNPVRVTTVPATNPAAPPTTGFRAARVMNLPGLEGVIGADTAGLQRQFGKPRLDVWEADARKLQFSGDACVLDIYLYPPSPGAAPRATYVDSRRASDGQDVDRAACVRALRKAD